MKVLKGMFPEVPERTIRQLRIVQNMSTNEVIDALVSQQEKAKPPTLPMLLAQYAHEMLDVNNEFVIKTNRSCIWNKARYKRAITTSPSMLKSQLMVEFCGEEGADAGALFRKGFTACK